MKNKISPTVVATAILSLVALVDVAQAEERSPWLLKGHGLTVVSDNTFSVDRAGSTGNEAGGNTQLGASFAVEYRLSELVGLELGSAYSKTPDVEGTDNGNDVDYGDGPSFAPLWAGVNFHLVRSGNWDVFVGPRLAFVKFSDFDLDTGGQKTHYEVDNEIAWGATAGMAYRLGSSGWSLSAEISYLDVDMEVNERGSAQTTVVGFNPITLGLGASYRF